MLTMKMTIAVILKNFRVTTEMKLEDVELTARSSLGSALGFPLKFYSRASMAQSGGL